MAVLFENAIAARKIFERLRARFGDADVSEEMIISIVRQLPNSHPHHYCVQIASKGEAASGAAASKPVMIATRSMTMTPNDSKNLEMFLAEYKRHGAFQLLPAALPSAGQAKPNFSSISASARSCSR